MKQIFGTGLRPRVFSLVMLLCGVPAMIAPAAAGTIKVTSEQIAKLGIQTAPAQIAKEQTITSVLGRVTPALNARLLVTAPYAGTAVRIDALEGKQVDAGDTLATIASRSYLEARSQLTQNAAEYEAAKAAATRTRKLVTEGIAAESRAEEAEAKAAQLRAAVVSARDALARVSAEPKKPGQYRIVAPNAGTIASIEIAPGQLVAEMAPVAALDSSDRLWIEVRLPAAFVGQVASGNVVEIEENGVRGQVIAVANSIDPHLRSAMLRASIPADSGLVVGQTIRISIMKPAEAGSLNVPRDAVVSMGEGSVVFVVRPDGFAATPVKVLAQGADDTTVTGEIEPGSKVAVAGLSELKVLAEQD